MADFRREVRARLAGTDVPEPLVAEVVEELSAHLEDVHAAARAEGESEPAARERALAELEGSERLVEAVRRARRSRRAPKSWKRGGMGVRRPSWPDRLVAVGRDVRQAVRVLSQRPLFALAALLTLAIGIGANSAVFSIVNGVLLRPLPFAEPDRLVRVWRAMPGSPSQPGPLTDAEVEQIASLEPVTSVAAMGSRTVRLEAGELGLQAEAAPVSPGFDETLGLRPAIGRWLGPDLAEEVVLTTGLARALFGSAESVVGRTVGVDDTPHRIVGLLPDEQALPSSARLWLPRPALGGTASRPGSLQVGGLGPVSGGTFRFASLDVVVRLGEADGLRALRAALQVLEERTDEAGRAGSGGYSAVPLHDAVVGDVGGVMQRFGLAVGLVLLLACANVANLMLEQATSRQQEFAVRRALGAGRARLLVQHLTESLVLALAGAAVGIVAARLVVGAFVRSDPLGVPRLDEVAIDLSTLGFTLALAVVTGVLFGLMPALRAAGARVADVLREGAQPGAVAERTWAGGLLAGVEIALATTLLIGAGLLVHSFIRMALVDPGYEPARLLAAQVRVDGSVAAETANRAVVELAREMSRDPRIPAASVADVLPPRGAVMERELLIEGAPLPEPGDRVRASIVKVGAGYMETLGIPLLAGRTFTAADVREARPVAIVSETLAQRHFPGGEAVGARFVMDGSLWEVAGVVGDARQGDIRDAPGPMVYQPRVEPVMEIAMGSRRMQMVTQAWVVARIQGDPRLGAEVLQKAAGSLPPGVRIDRVEVVADRVWESIATPRFFAGAFGAFAATALLLAAVGVYAVMAYNVRRRIHDLGVRLAVGARPADVLGLVMRRGLTIIGGGVTAGMVGALLLSRTIEGFLFAIDGTDGVTYALVALLLVTVAAVAAYLPARRAVAIDPVDALLYRPR